MGFGLLHPVVYYGLGFKKSSFLSNGSHQLSRRDGQVFDLAPAHDEHILDLGRLPTVDPE